MNDQVTPEGGALPSDANASPEIATPDGATQAKGSEADSSPAATESEPKPKKSGQDIRIDELTRRLREAERRNDRLLRLAEERTHAPEPVQQKAAPEPRKTLKDFNFDEAAFESYVEDRVSKLTDRAVETKLTEKQREQQAAERTRTFRARESEFAKTVEDYAEVAHFSPISQAVAELVTELESGPEVAYHLGQHPELAEKLSAMPVTAAALELGRLEVRLAADREKLKAKAVSQAPPPTPKIEGTNPGDFDNDTPNSSWSDARYAKWREKQKAQRRSGIS